MLSIISTIPSLASYSVHAKFISLIREVQKNSASIMKNTSTDIYYSEKHSILSDIVASLVATGLYTVGVYFHTKIITVSKKEKDLTWKIDIAHSFITLFTFTYYFVMGALTYLIPDVYLLTGEWFCYGGKFIGYATITYISRHSLIIALLKYFIIMKQERADVEKLKKVFLWIDLIHPMIDMTLIMILNPEFYVSNEGSVRYVSRCLGKPTMKGSIGNSVCKNIKFFGRKDILHVFNALRNIPCISVVVLRWIMNYNILEMFLYFRIFAHMRRYVLL